jgi:hypothetical protein
MKPVPRASSRLTVRRPKALRRTGDAESGVPAGMRKGRGPQARKRRRRYDPPLDDGVRKYVEALAEEGVETFESCEGGNGHTYGEPTVRFHGGLGEGFRALAVTARRGFPVTAIRRTWIVVEGEPVGPYWEIVFASKAA